MAWRYTFRLGAEETIDDRTMTNLPARFRLHPPNSERAETR